MCRLKLLLAYVRRGLLNVEPAVGLPGGWAWTSKLSCIIDLTIIFIQRPVRIDQNSLRIVQYDMAT